MNSSSARSSVDLSSSTIPNPKYEHDQEAAGLLPSPTFSDDSREAKRGAKHRWHLGGRCKTWWWDTFRAVLGLLIGLIGITGWVMYWRALPGVRLMGEINGLVPEFPVVPVLFDDDPRSTPDHKTAESANATYEYWASFMPVGNGFMSVPHDDSHVLPPPMVGEAGEYYSIAVFHQLHCLHSVMKMWNQVNDELEQQATSGQLRGRNDDDIASDGKTMSRNKMRRHVDHRFRYLRQSIVCCADTALEGQNLKAKIPDTDGTGATHLRKDFYKVRAWAEERRISDGHAI
ncbi:hypothetical protein B0J18DRAFT_469915 [Chaetomium sp. MPI-SDFR-AT-0129]|nr:hypothetical protein B0J18DRAFT_469915 [Chaetomium sp. MPI-SDFR-AT-0129]